MPLLVTMQVLSAACAHAVQGDQLRHTSKHQSSDVLTNSYLGKVPTISTTLFAAGYGGDPPAGLFHWQLHYTQGRQLLTTDVVRELLGPYV